MSTALPSAQTLAAKIERSLQIQQKKKSGGITYGKKVTVKDNMEIVTRKTTTAYQNASPIN